MKLVLATKLSFEECTKRLTNAIDPIPSVQERIDKAPNTSLSPDPLPDAGDRVTGFGYSPGTRPVVGTINNKVFHLEKRAVELDARTPDVRIRKTPATKASLASNICSKGQSSKHPPGLSEKRPQSCTPLEASKNGRSGCNASPLRPKTNVECISWLKRSHGARGRSVERIGRW